MLTVALRLHIAIVKVLADILRFQLWASSLRSLATLARASSCV
jgi:hypothetical protein